MTEQNWEADLDGELDDITGEDMSAEARTAALNARLAAGGEDDDSGDESDEETGDEPATVDAGLDLILNGEEQAKFNQKQADELFSSQLAEAERLSPGYREPEGEQDEYTKAAIAVAGMDTNEFNKFKATLQDAIDAKARELRGGEEGFDAAGDPVEPPFDPSTLDSAAFAAFTRAAASGGVSMRDVPAGETYESWSAKVSSALGR